MKSIDWEFWLFLAALAFIFWPLAIGVVDVAAYIVTGAQVSGIAWLGAQGGWAICWSIVWLALFLALIS